MSWYPPKPKRRPGSGPWRAAGKRPFGATWWGQAWVDAIEQRARLDQNRLPRGRTYARTGAVDDLEVNAGEVIARVQGSRATPYKVTVRVRRYSEEEWQIALAALGRQAGHLAALLDGEMPPEVAADLADAGIDLLPVAGELQPRCSCPDWADPCKHSAAVCYLVADTLDTDPFLLFLMRGRDREHLLAGLRASRVAAGDRSGDPAAAVSAADAPSWPQDGGVPARDAWARWTAAGGTGRPPLPPIPLPPSRPGHPTVLATDPPAGAGLTSAGLQLLAADTAERALQLARGAATTGLELAFSEDLARRAAGLLRPGTPDDQLGALATAAGVAPFDLVRSALAWRHGGREGLFVLIEPVQPPAGAMSRGRELLGSGATVWRNRVTLGDRQLRYGRDGLWYPYRRAGRGRTAFVPDGDPFDADAPDREEVATF